MIINLFGNSPKRTVLFDERVCGVTAKADLIPHKVSTHHQKVLDQPRLILVHTFFSLCFRFADTQAFRVKLTESVFLTVMNRGLHEYLAKEGIDRPSLSTSVWHAEVIVRSVD